MRRLFLFLIIMCMFVTSAKLKLLNLKQELLDAKEKFYMLHSATIPLEIPLTGDVSWNCVQEHE